MRLLDQENTTLEDAGFQDDDSILAEIRSRYDIPAHRLELGLQSTYIRAPDAQLSLAEQLRIRNEFEVKLLRKTGKI
jgi:hypothetical protein